MKRDLERIVERERRPLSRTCAGVLRLGIGRYFELDDAKMAAPLLKAMRDVYWSEDDPISKTKRRENTREFDSAIQEGKREFATTYREGSRNRSI